MSRGGVKRGWGRLKKGVDEFLDEELRVKLESGGL